MAYSDVFKWKALCGHCCRTMAIDGGVVKDDKFCCAECRKALAGLLRDAEQMQRAAILALPWDRLDLCDRVHSALSRAPRFTSAKIGDVCMMTRAVAIRLKSVGEKSVRSLESSLAEHGLRLGMGYRAIEEWVLTGKIGQVGDDAHQD